MLKNYLKIAWRYLLKNKAHSFINIAGLSAGMAVAMLIALWIRDEWNFDRVHTHYNSIAQVLQQRRINGRVETSEAVPIPLNAALHAEYKPYFSRIAMATMVWPHAVAAGEQVIDAPGHFIAPEGPDLLSLDMIAGRRDALKEPNAILIAASLANALYGNQVATGQTLQLDNKGSFKVAGVYKDLPANSTFHKVTFMAPWAYFQATEQGMDRSLHDWGDNFVLEFVQLAPGMDAASVSARIRDVKKKHIDREDAAYEPAMILQPMANWHLYSQFRDGRNAGGRIQYVWLFGIIGAFVLLLACINFMNLSTARSAKRAKEVGLRKAVGSLRVQLVMQFYSESVLMAVIAFGIALLAVVLLLPSFNLLADKEIVMPWNQPWFWISGAAFTIGTALLAGSYPALFLSSFQPLKVLKGNVYTGRQGALPRKILVVLQFTVSVLLIIGTLIVFRQIRYAKNRPVGYDREGLVSVSTGTMDIHNHFEAVKADLLRSGVVTAVAQSSSPLTGVNNNSGDVSWEGKPAGFSGDFGIVRVTMDYPQTVGMRLLQGRSFSNAYATDSMAVLLNERAVQYMGLEHPLGAVIKLGKQEMHVIGIVKDMVMQSPYEPVKQTIFRIGKAEFDFLNLRVNPHTNMHDALTQIETVYKTYSPATPFTYRFVDVEYGRKFVNEERIGNLAGIFAALAIFISCLGLFGMATFMAEQRIREIGIRKVMGASVTGLWALLSREFVWLVGIALLIAIPAGYLGMNRWLSHFPYHTPTPWWIYAGTGFGALLLTLLTVSYQGIRAALANPVKNLRAE